MVTILTPTADDPYPAVEDPAGNRWVWDPDTSTLRNTTADAPVSPEQTLRNFQVAEARFRCELFIAGTLWTRFSAPHLDLVRVPLRACLVQLLAVRGITGAQYNCWDFVDEVWIDPSTGNPLPADWPGGGLLNAELQLKGGFGDQL